MPSQYRFGTGCKIHGAWSATSEDCDDDFFNWASCEIWRERAVASVEVSHLDASLEAGGDTEVNYLALCLTAAVSRMILLDSPVARD